MTTTVTVDTTKTPNILTVKTDKHVEVVTATVTGDVGTGTIVFPINVTDSTGRVWTQISDDKATPTSTVTFTG